VEARKELRYLPKVTMHPIVYELEEESQLPFDLHPCLPNCCRVRSRCLAVDIPPWLRWPWHRRKWRICKFCLHIGVLFYYLYNPAFIKPDRSGSQLNYVGWSAAEPSHEWLTQLLEHSQWLKSHHHDQPWPCWDTNHGWGSLVQAGIRQCRRHTL
jgi:hypothetical protein